MKDFTEKTIQSKHIFTGNVISLQVDDVSLPNGQQSKRELVKHPGAVAIIPITPEGKIIFVKQYRKAIDRVLIEIPAGKIEPNEDKETTAIRELEEETGYTSEQLTYVHSFYTSPGFANEIIHLYYTNALKELAMPVPGDEDEFIELLELTIEEAEQLVKEKQIFDAKTMYALLYLKMLG